MKCERAIEMLATGTAVGRWMARRHAVRCRRCAAEAARFARFADALAAAEPLTPAQRALWTSASTEPRRGEAKLPWSRRVRLAATAAVFLFAALLAFVAFRPPLVKPPIDAATSPTVKAEKPRRQASPVLIRELDALTSDFRSLSQELAQLSGRARLLDERRDAEALTRRFVAMNTP
jgi:hypothetical protein